MSDESDNPKGGQAGPFHLLTPPGFVIRSIEPHPGKIECERADSIRAERDQLRAALEDRKQACEDWQKTALHQGSVNEELRKALAALIEMLPDERPAVRRARELLEGGK